MSYGREREKVISQPTDNSKKYTIADEINTLTSNGVFNVFVIEELQKANVKNYSRDSVFSFGQCTEKKYNFFFSDNVLPYFIFSKQGLIDYLIEAKDEYFLPSRKYKGKNGNGDISWLYKGNLQQVRSLKGDLKMFFKKRNMKDNSFYLTEKTRKKMICHFLDKMLLPRITQLLFYKKESEEEKGKYVIYVKPFLNLENEVKGHKQSQNNVIEGNKIEASDDKVGNDSKRDIRKVKSRAYNQSNVIEGDKTEIETFEGIDLSSQSNVIEDDKGEVPDGIDSDCEEIKIVNEKRVTVEARNSPTQERYKKRLLKRMPECIFTGIKTKELLVACHIKGYSVCKNENREECFDLNNGLIMTPTYHTLFDKGLISFDENCDLLVSNKLSSSEVKKLNLQRGKHYDLNKGKYKHCDFDKIKYYIEYHRKNVFKPNKTSK